MICGGRRGVGRGGVTQGLLQLNNNTAHPGKERMSWFLAVGRSGQITTKTSDSLAQVGKSELLGRCLVKDDLTELAEHVDQRFHSEMELSFQLLSATTVLDQFSLISDGSGDMIGTVGQRCARASVSVVEYHFDRRSCTGKCCFTSEQFYPCVQGQTLD